MQTRTVENPIPNSRLFTTPTLEEIQKFISTMPSKEQAQAQMLFMFTLNACHQLVEDQVFSREIFV